MTATCRRALPDRRGRPTPALSPHLFRGRRREGRRDGEAWNVYVDRHAASEYAPLLVLLALAVLDWLWTLRHLGRGIEEANPWLRWTFEQGGAVGFSMAKLGITALVGSFLLLHLRFRLVRKLLPVALAVYVAVLGAHVLAELS